MTATDWLSVEISLECSCPADIQGDAMKPATQHFGMPQLERDDIYALLLQQLDQCRLVLSTTDQVRVDAEQVHIDPLAANAL